jgi:putative acetyltransferase
MAVGESEARRPTGPRAMSARAALPALDLRAYREADLKSVRTLHALAFESLAADRHSPEQLAAHTAMTQTDAYAADLRASHLTLAIGAEGTVAGTAGWIAVADEAATARIRKVFVHPDLARRGLASLLVRDAEARARAQGYRRIIVRANLNAVPLYAKLGYRTLEEGGMDAGNGIVLPVHYMEKT